MDEEIYKDKLLILSNKVDEMTSVRQKSFIPNIIPNYINPMYIYIGIPIICYIILFITKPDIIMVKMTDNNTFFTSTKISYYKLFLITIFIIIVELILYFTINVKRKS